MSNQEFIAIPKSCSALALDDDMGDRFRLTKICRKAGMDLNFHEAADLVQLKDRLDEVSFDIIFIDFHLGLSNGHQALEIIKSSERQADAISIMVTSENRPEVIIEATRNGCSDYILKDDLSVDGIQNSVSLAFERQLFAAITNRDVVRSEATQGTMRRLNACLTPEMRRIMSATLQRRKDTDYLGGECKELEFGADLESVYFEMISVFGEGDHDHLGQTDIPMPHDQERRKIL
ncbi:response regulator [Puniceibacterium sediminis]|nr:response regulator [Puniceibacterium sediminis]